MPGRVKGRDVPGREPIDFERLVDVRYASCDFSGQELQKHISYMDQPFGNRSMCDMRFVIFQAKSYKSTYRTGTNRSESVDVRYASCDFMAKSYNSRYRTSTNRSKSIGSRPGTSPFNTAWHLALLTRPGTSPF